MERANVSLVRTDQTVRSPAGGPAFLLLLPGLPVNPGEELVGGLSGPADLEPESVRGIAVAATPAAAGSVRLDEIGERDLHRDVGCAELLQGLDWPREA